MIVTLEGMLVESNPVQSIIETRDGLGYEVNMPITTTERLPLAGNQVKLFTLVVYREESQTLYGFYELEERDFFRLLVEKVSGIGPKTALGIMSQLSLGSLKNAIVYGDVALLSKCPGIGKKTAERLILELKDKLLAFKKTEVTTLPESSTIEINVEGTGALVQDAVAALVTLGYKPADADKRVRKVIQASGDSNIGVEVIIKKALG